MALELRILSPQEDGFLNEIDWNFEELKNGVAAKLEDYKCIAYTEDNVKDMKSDKALLNKLRTAVEDERKRVKRLCMEPYNRFEAQIREVVGLIDEPIYLIDSQLKQIDNRYKDEKKSLCMEIYERNIGTLKGIVPFERAFRDYFLNKSMSEKKIEEEMAGMFSRVNSELDTIESLNSEYEAQIKTAYISALDLSVALREKEKIERAKAALKERKAKEEVEREALEEQAAVEQMATPVKEEPKKQPEPVRMDAQEVTLDFRVTCTREQLELLKKFLILNHIKVSKVPR